MVPYTRENGEKLVAVFAKKELDMENQSKLGKYLVERTIKEISTEFTP